LVEKPQPQKKLCKEAIWRHKRRGENNSRLRKKDMVREYELVSYG